MKRSLLVLEDQQGNSAAVPVGACASCRFHAPSTARFRDDGNGCMQGQPTEAWEQYKAFGGCPVWSLGLPLDTDPDNQPEWWPLVQQAGLAEDAQAGSGAVNLKLIDVDIEGDDVADQPPEEATGEYVEPTGELPDYPWWWPDEIEEDLDKAYNPSQPRDKNGQWVKVGTQYTHPKYGPATVTGFTPQGEAMITYQSRYQAGVTRNRVVNPRDLTPTGSVQPPAQTLPQPKPLRAMGPVPVVPPSTGNAEARILAVQAQRRPALKKWEAAVQGILPKGVEFKAREKSLQSAQRDARWADKDNNRPPGTTDPATLADLVGMKAIFKDNKQLVETAAKLRAAFPGQFASDRAYGIKDPGAGFSKHAKGGYHAVHFNTNDDVEIQFVTQRGQHLAHAVHDLFYNYHLKNAPDFQDFKMYERAVGEHYNRLDDGLTSTPPAAPAIARRFNLVFPDDPLKSRKGEEFEMKDTLYENRLAKLQPKTEVPLYEDAELNALARGEAVAVKDTDDHAAHLARHLNDKKVVLGKSLRGIGGDQTVKTLKNLEAHIEAHRKLLRPQHLG